MVAKLKIINLGVCKTLSLEICFPRIQQFFRFEYEIWSYSRSFFRPVLILNTQNTKVFI